MILHMLLFFRLPYHHSSDGSKREFSGGDMARLEKEVQEYQGCVNLFRIFRDDKLMLSCSFKRTSPIVASFERRGLSGAYAYLLESLLNRVPKKRPTCEQVLRAIREGNVSFSNRLQCCVSLD